MGSKLSALPLSMFVKKTRGYFSCCSFRAALRSILFLPLPVRVGGGLTAHALLSEEEKPFVQTYQTVVDLFKRNVLFGDELGAQITIYHNSKKVVDVWGSMDAHHSTAGLYDANTVQTVFSSTKNLTALCVCMLADRGLLDLDDKVSKFWPEFGQNGKEDIRISDVLRHEAGLGQLVSNEDPDDPKRDYKLTFEDIEDLDQLSEIFAKAKPYWEEGKKRSYHAILRGFILGEIIRRVDEKKRSLQQFFAEEVALPLQIDAWIGTPSVIEQERHIPNMTQIDTPRQLFEFAVNPPKPELMEAFKNPKSMLNRMNAAVFVDGTPRLCNTKRYRSLQVGSASGTANSAALAKVGAAIANGGIIDGVRIMSEAGVKNMLSEPLVEYDAALLFETSFTKGGVCKIDECKEFDKWRNGKWFGWGGWGGSIFFFSPEKNLSFAYTMNGMHNDIIGGRRVEKLLALLSNEVI
eukprot:CAMPEP_0184060318 /NCGR_PEP_ID=MMETSP0956-20121227/10696_1 /TAXON_ID=627963 /ORGANISM="Aplanochytrium sp, Strain PBS07" /LENGTH=463 /DNA_ID=CAMNT_0026356301 /DNA_START=28 /DNA_END=1419 /DNA_ORIENTATION=+